jgi:propionyl-CoA carboxylase alpha chain
VERHVDVAGGSGKPFLVAFWESGGKRGSTFELKSTWWPGEPAWAGRVGVEEVTVQVRPFLNGYELAWRGISLPVWVYTTREAELAALMPKKADADTSKQLLCPMPGLVKALNVAVGQEVKAGDALAIVEAMKMENILRADRDAVVKKINAKAGDSLAVDAVIMEFA